MIGQIKQQIHELVQRYEQRRDYYRTDEYNETQVRSDFLDPLFEYLGWDIRNKTGKSTNEREVLLEEPLKANVNDHTKKPDYTFRLYGERKFFLEAKKPCVHIDNNNEPAKQVRRYGFTAGLKISVLSNFEDLFIYDTTVPVSKDDDSLKARIKTYHYTDYEDSVEELLSFLGKGPVYSGKFDEVWKDINLNVDFISIDRYFVEDINTWRLMLGRELYAIKPEISIDNAGDIVQRYINKILFLRVCEDRNIELYQTLSHIASKNDGEQLINKFKQADKRYNSGLFKEETAEDMVCNLSSSFWAIIRKLYFPDSTYSFTVFSSDILGRIYEVFLSKRFALLNGELELVDKPENVDKDIVTTPNYIVREILGVTLKHRVNLLDPDGVQSLKIADIACGSGVFLLEAYQMLCDAVIDYHLSHNNESLLIKTGKGTYKLPYNTKKDILVKCIYGVDKDRNAVEACKFGLLLKLLEDENPSTLPTNSGLLPDLSNNIKCGNSLISIDEAKSDETAFEINAYDFNLQFDYIIGNPPYMKTEDIKNITPDEYRLYPSIYTSAKGQYDKYFLFIERSMHLLKENGMLGYIVPNKFTKLKAATELRKFISSNNYLHTLMSFGASQIFRGKSTYSCILVLQKSNSQNTFRYSLVKSIKDWKLKVANVIEEYTSPYDSIDDRPWVLPVGQARMMLENKINPVSERLEVILDTVGTTENIYNGIQTSSNSTYVFDVDSQDENYFYFTTKKGVHFNVEKELTKPYYKTPRGKAFDSLETFVPNSRIIYPYKKVGKNVKLIKLEELKSKYHGLYTYITNPDVENVLKDPKRDMDKIKDSAAKWYRYGRNQNLDKCEVKEKIIVGVLAQEGRYAIDKTQTLITSGGTAGYCIIKVPSQVKYSIYYIQALLCSVQGEWLAALFGEYFQNGYIARGTKILRQLPIRKINFEDEEEKKIHDSIVMRQKKLIELGNKLKASKNSPRDYDRYKRLFEKKKKEQQTEINRLYNMDDNDIDVLLKLTQDLYAAN